MKTNIYKIIILLLVLCLGYVIYQLSSDTKQTNITQETQKNTAVDIKTLKKDKKVDITQYKMQTVDTSKADAKLNELNEQLQKTQEMLTQHKKENVTNKKTISKEDLEKLQSQINEVRKTISKVSTNINTKE